MDQAKPCARSGATTRLIDPAAKTLEGTRWLNLQTCGGADRVRAEPFDAIETALDALWA